MIHMSSREATILPYKRTSFSAQSDFYIIFHTKQISDYVFILKCILNFSLESAGSENICFASFFCKIWE